MSKSKISTNKQPELFINDEDLNFSKCKISTRTFIIKTNFKTNIDEWFDTIDQNVNYKNLEIASKIKNNKFKNCFQIVVNWIGSEVKNLDLNFRSTVKICNNGSFHFTGCKYFPILEECVVNLIKTRDPTFPLEIIFIPVMLNVRFQVNPLSSIEKTLSFFNNYVDREEFFAINLNHNPAVNIKTRMSKEVLQEFVSIKIKKFSNNFETFEEIFEPYYDYSKKTCKKKNMEEKYTTFIVFRSGTVIMSSINESIMKQYFIKFNKLIEKMEEL